MKSKLQTLLSAHKQEHLLRFWDELSADQQTHLASQIEAIDFSQIDRLIQQADATVDYDDLSRQAEPPRAVKADGSGAAWSVEDAIDSGAQAIGDGEVAMILVAGGQGSRLGFDKPKSLFPIGPLSERTLLQIHADRLKAISTRYGVPIPMYLMTSPATHEATVQYIKHNDNLGLPSGDLRIFCQGSMPAVDIQTGKILLEGKDSLALSPDGHGGTASAFAESGCLDHAISAGIKHLCYAQIDNPLAAPCDEALIGNHIKAASEMTTQVVRKREPLEKVGNVVLIDDKVHIIEYIHLSDDAANQTQADGSLKLWAGNIAVHIFSTDFLKRSTDTYDNLPFNRAYKKVAHLDQAGNLVQPAEPNAIKFERFIFDLLPAAANAFVVEGLASEIFAPLKNAEGSPADTPTTVRRAISDLHTQWLRAADVQVREGTTIEIHPSWACHKQEVIDRTESGHAIEEDTYFRPDPDDDRLVPVKRCNTAVEARIVQVQLSGEGILCFVEGTNSSITLSSAGTPSKGIPVLVRSRDAARAQSVLGL